MLPLLKRTLWLLVLCPTVLLGQTIEEEQRLSDKIIEESPSNSEYTLFTPLQTLASKAYQRIYLRLLPIAYNYRGEPNSDVEIFGMAFADGVTPSSFTRQARRLQMEYQSDTLLFAHPLLGCRGKAVAPEQFFGEHYQFSLYGAAGLTSAGGIEAKLTNADADVPYSVWLQGRFGPSLYGGGENCYEGVISALLNHRDWSFWLYFAPSVRDVRTASVDEAFELTGDRHYNPSCGLFEGRVRNVARRRELSPVAGVMRRWQTGNSLFRVQMAVRAGEYSRSLLDSYAGLSAYPDHHRSLPSGAISETAREQLTEAWQGGAPEVVGIAWDKLQQINSANGVAAYSVNSHVERMASVNISASATGVRGGWRWVARAHLRYDNSALYKRIDDLLGATHALNIDYYNSDFGGRIEQNNADNPNQRVGKGDRVDYNYRISRVDGGLDGSLRYSSKRFSLDASLMLGVEGLSRRGLWRKTSREDSFGCGRMHLFADCATEIVGRYHWGTTALISARLWCATTPPDYDNLYLSPENSSTTIADYTTPLRYGVEVEGRYNAERLSLLGSLYVLGAGQEVEVRRYYDDYLGEYANLALTNINTIMAGATLSANYSFNNHIAVSVAIDCHYDCYTSSPRATIYSDADGQLLLQSSPSRLKGFRTGRTPSLSAVASIEGVVAGHWWLMGGVCGVAGRHIAPNPLYRMEHLSNICPSKEHYDAMFAQRSLGGVMTLEGAIGRSIDVGKGSLMIRLTARGFVAGDRTFYAYEQMRLRRVYDTTGQKYVAAPIKRTYAYPFVAMLTISLTR